MQLSSKCRSWVPVLWTHGKRDKLGYCTQDLAPLYSRKLPNQLLIFSCGCSSLYHLHFSLFCIECNKAKVVCNFFPFFLLFSECVQEGYMIMERRKKNSNILNLSFKQFSKVKDV